MRCGTWIHVLRDVEGVHGAGELRRVVVDVADGDVDPYVGGLLAVVRPHQERILRPPLSVQTLGGDQLAGFGIDAEAVVRSADDGVSHQSVRTLNKTTHTLITRFINIRFT